MTTGNSDTSSSAKRPQSPEPPLPSGVENALDRFARSFESSARRWEFVVYPSLFAFSILAAYGFFLIYSLTKDMTTLAQNVDPKMASNMGSMSRYIGVMSEDMGLMRGQITKMVTHIENMDENISTLNGSITAMNRSIDLMESHTIEISDKLSTLEPILSNMELMNQSMGRMTVSTGVMSRDMSNMNYNVGRPMSFMNQFLPW